VKSVPIVSFTVLAVITFAESPRRVPSDLAGQIEEAVEENVLSTFKVLKEDNQDMPAFERAISKMLVYVRQGSVTNKAPQVLTSELNGYCNPTDNPLWTEFISEADKDRMIDSEAPQRYIVHERARILRGPQVFCATNR